MNLWTHASLWGTASLRDLREIRYVILCNRASMLVSLFSIILTLIAFVIFGWMMVVSVSLLASIILLFPLVLNYLGWIKISRVLFSITLSLACVAVSVIDKISSLQFENMQFYEFRLLLLSATIFPFILFSIKEYYYWITALVVNLASIVLYDSAHEWFGVGYYQVGLTGTNYFFINYMMVGAFLIISSSAYFLKIGFEKAEWEKEKLIQELSRQKSLIERQREQLVLENMKLNSDLVEKNNQLLKTNQELVQHNNDLQQFSYTISHNLRGPVASINGLLNLLKEEELGRTNQELMPHFRGAIASLDHTIKDLGNIIDVRNGLNRIREKIVIQEEIHHILTLLKKEIEDNRIEIDVQVEPSLSFLSVKSMVASILHNLISNAIKYKSTERVPKITIRVTVEDDFAKLIVSDNGLGIDLDRHRDNIFGIYKRFHSHVDGKGLGLFLVKLQAESLGGHVEIASTPNQGTTFRIFIRLKENGE